MPAVVVLPLVALIRVEPSVRRDPRRSIASGAMRSSMRPGSVVPPPRPERRERPPAALATASFARKAPASCPSRAHGTESGGHDHAQGAWEDANGGGELCDRVAVCVHGERAVGLDQDLGRLPRLHLERFEVLALEDLTEASQEAKLRDVAAGCQPQAARRPGPRWALRSCRRRRPSCSRRRPYTP